MIDINQLLTQVMGGALGQAGPVDSNQSGTSRQEPPAAGRDAPITYGRSRWPTAQQMSDQANGLGGYVGALGTGALAGGLAGVLFGNKRMREVAGAAVHIGAVAAIGGLAYKAYQNHRQGKPIVPQSITDMLAGGSPQPHDPNAAQPSSMEAWIPPQHRSADVARLLLRAMVAAATADGHLDATEYDRIGQQLRAGDLNQEEQLFLSQLIMRPSTIQELAAAADSPELRVEVYAAARLAINPDAPAERDWLEQLSAALKLEPGLKAHLDAIGGAGQAQAA